MLLQTFAYSLAKCDNCSKWIIYKTVDGLPQVCPTCGVPANYSLTPEEKRRFEEMNSGQQTIFIRR